MSTPKVPDKFNKWEIWMVPFPSKDDPHPVVLISPQHLCKDARIKYVNGLVCTSIRGDRAANPYEVVLNGADGLDGRTTVTVMRIHDFSKSQLYDKRGLVSFSRRKAIARKMMEHWATGD